MKRIRSVFRVALILIFTLVSYFFYWIAYGLINLLGLNYQPLRNAYMRFWSRGMAFILNIRIKIIGTPPKAPFFLVSNHLSYIDIIPLFLHLRCTFVAKKEVRKWPLLGYMVATMGVIFVDRSRKRDVKRVNDLLRKSLTSYQGVIVFPEGTTSGGDKIFPFRPPLLEFPAAEQIPVHYSSIRYETDERSGDLPAERSVCFYGARDPFHKHVAMLAGNRQINCTIHFSSFPVTAGDRKQLAEQLRKKVSSIFEPMQG